MGGFSRLPYILEANLALTSRLQPHFDQTFLSEWVDEGKPFITASVKQVWFTHM